MQDFIDHKNVNDNQFRMIEATRLNYGFEVAFHGLTSILNFIKMH